MCYNCVTSSYHFVFFKHFTPPDKHSLTAPPPTPPRSPTPNPSPLERGVNSFANHSRTVVSVPRPPTRSKGIYSPLPLDLWSLARARTGRGWGWGCIFGCWRTGHRDHRPTMVCLAHHMNSSLFTLHYATVLLWFARPFTPLHKGRGKPCASTARGRGCGLLGFGSTILRFLNKEIFFW